MERWTWPFILQQIVVLLAWVWLMQIAWREIREVLGERKEQKPRGYQMETEHAQKPGSTVIFQDGKAARQ